MTDRALAEIVCRALYGIIKLALTSETKSSAQRARILADHLIAIASAIRERYGLPKYEGVTIEIKESDTLAGVTSYE